MSVDLEPSLKSQLSDLSNIGLFYANSVFFDDYVLPTNLSSTKTFSLSSNVAGVDSLDDSSSSLKGLDTLTINSFKHGVNVNTVFPTTTSTLDVLNAFRSDFEDYTWFTDLSSLMSQPSPTLLDSQILDAELLLSKVSA